MAHPTRHIVATAPEVPQPLPDGWSLWTHGIVAGPPDRSLWIAADTVRHPDSVFVDWQRTGRSRLRVHDEPATAWWPAYHARYMQIEIAPPGAIEIGGRWVDPADLGTQVYVPREGSIGYWVDTTRRLMRAVAGTPVPDGWAVVEDPDPLAVWAPLALDQWRAQNIADMARQTPQTTVVVADRPDDRGRWEAWRGVGGCARSIGRYPTREAARDAAIAQIEAWRAEHAWLERVAPWPAIEVIDARSPGWREVDGTRQALTAEVEALAAEGWLILDEPVDDAVTRLIERQYRPGRLRAELTAR